MGSCLQVLFGTNRSSLKHETLLNYKQLTSMIKASTRNDFLFYSSSNLSIVQEYLNSFKADTTINTQFINKNINILNTFIQSLKDRTSPIGKQLLSDQQNINKYLDQEQNMDAMQKFNISDLIVLRIELQVLLASLTIVEILQDNDWDLVIDIQEDQTDNFKPQSRIESIYKEEVQRKIQFINSILIRKQPNPKYNHDNEDALYTEKPFIKPSNFAQQSVDKIQSNELNQKKTKKNQHDSKIKKQCQESIGNTVQQYAMFEVSSKIVLRKSKININLYKLRKKKASALRLETGSPEKLKQKQKQTSVGHKKNNKNDKILLGHTSLSVSDFIFYNSLMVSDVVPINSVSLMKSSITTTTSSATNSCIIAFISLRGQGIQAETLNKDYFRIIKQHQTVAMQLHMCLEGDKAWEKLSQFRQSSSSQKDQSLYSEYSIPQDGPLRYKI